MPEAQVPCGWCGTMISWQEYLLGGGACRECLDNDLSNEEREGDVATDAKP